MAPLIVTGYVPLRDHPRSEAEYRKLGGRLTAMTGVKLYEDTLDNFCWMWGPAKRYANSHSVADNPEKNTVGYHVVQHQKIAWLARALFDEPHADPLIWIDYGVFHLPDITERLIRSFLLRVVSQPVTRITLPGCWPLHVESSPRVPCWRFCGTVAIVPRRFVLAFDTGVKVIAMERMMRERSVTWEINTWARLEHFLPEMFTWYQANHDATLFSNFRGDT